VSIAPRPRRRHGLLRTNAWLVYTATVITLGVAALVAATATVTFTSTAEVVVKPQPTAGAPIEPQMGTERAIAESGAVAERAAQSLGEEPAAAQAGLSVSVALDTTVLVIQYRADTAQEALDGARAFTNAYLDFRNSDQSARVAEAVTQPDLPAHGSGANLVLVLGLGLLAGLCVGVAAAWVYDRVVDSVRDAGELEEQTGLPVIGAVPRWSRHPGRDHPPRPAREAFGYVAAALLAETGGRRHGVTVAITSPRVGAGTTTVAVHTARALAAQGREVVLVGADLHDAHLQECLEVAPSPGLVDVLHSDCTVEGALQRTSDPHLRVLVAGTEGDTDLRLNVDNLQLLLAQLGSRALVLVDAPPLLSRSESVVLAEHADLVLLVANLRGGTRRDAAAAAALLQGLRTRVAGWVVNRPPRGSRRTHRRGPEPTPPEPTPAALRPDPSLRS
jgi:Mrp family chromosome partitioning ATPase